MGSCVGSAATMADDGLAIDYRQQVMKTKQAQTAAIGQILTQTVPEENIISHFEILLLATRQSKAAFAKKVLGGNSQPIIWERWDDFSARLARVEADLVVAIDTLRTQGVTNAGELAVTVTGCKDCHDIYKK